jgi:hypothetical protein
VAIAQSATDTDITPAPGTTALVPTPDASAPGGMSTSVVTTPASSRTIQPSNAHPRRDDRGIAVISDPAVVPDGFNGVTGSQSMGGPVEDTANVETVPTTSAGVPVCSRTITDHCIESYRQDYTGR